MKGMIYIALLCAFLVGCAGYRPIVDMKGVDRRTYESDLRECQAYAEQISPAGQSVAVAFIGAGIGAVLGAVVGSFFGEADLGAGFGAALGGTEGAISGAASGAQTQVDIIRNCMSGRGYSVLH